MTWRGGASFHGSTACQAGWLSLETEGAFKRLTETRIFFFLLANDPVANNFILPTVFSSHCLDAASFSWTILYFPFPLCFFVLFSPLVVSLLKNAIGSCSVVMLTRPSSETIVGHPKSR